MMRKVVREIEIADSATWLNIFGAREERLRRMEKALGVRFIARGTRIQIEGDEIDVEKADVLLTRMIEVASDSGTVDRLDLDRPITETANGKDPREMASKGTGTKEISITVPKRVIRPKSANQANYVRAMFNSDMVFAVGPAGTGKTYLAMAVAISSLLKKEVERIILTRPAVEAGEKLGFLPGDIQEKVNPYLRPLYDALYDMVELGRADRMITRGLIEVAPLAFMRGRTLGNAFVIMDEAQNTSPEQMKMLLTRIGFGSKAVITGDITQVDLPRGSVSGLIHAIEVLEGIDGIDVVRLTEGDVVRHPLVQQIIWAYDSRGVHPDEEEEAPP